MNIITQSPDAGHAETFEFEFGGMKIRAVFNEDGNPWFIAKDVCEALGIINVSQALDGLRRDEKGICKIYSLKGLQDTLVTTESGLYRLIFRSNKPEAEEFRLWVFQEVLPQIRKTGMYLVEEIKRQKFKDFIVSQHASLSLEELIQYSYDEWVRRGNNEESFWAFFDNRKQLGH